MSVRAYIVAGVLAALLAVFATQQARIGMAVRKAQAALEDAEQSKARANLLAAELDFSYLTGRVLTEYVDRVTVIRERGQTIVREVPTYVTPAADTRCTVPAGFVSLHNAAAQGAVPDPAAAGSADAPAAGVALSTVASTVAANYTTCHANAQQLISLQQWVSQTIAAAAANNP